MAHRRLHCSCGSLHDKQALGQMRPCQPWLWQDDTAGLRSRLFSREEGRSVLLP